MVDVRVGVTDLDLQFARMVKRLDKQVILVANKSETPRNAPKAGNFSSGWASRARSALTGYACLSPSTKW